MRAKAVAIFGVGRLGSGLAQELIRNGTFDKIYLSNRLSGVIDSLVLSLKVFACYIGKQVIIESFHDKLPSDVGFVVISLKENYDPRLLLQSVRLPQGLERNLRTIGIRKDLPLVRDACSRMSGFTGVVAVLTNPVDIFTVLVKGWLPHATVYGLGISLDSARLAYCANQRGIRCLPGDALLGGAHIGFLVQLKSLWNSNGLLSRLTDAELDGMLRAAAKIGPAIVRGLGFTLHDCVPVFSKDVEWLCGKGGNTACLCASVGDNTSAVAWPLVYSDDRSRIERWGQLEASELAELERASQFVGQAVELVRRRLI